MKDFEDLVKTVVNLLNDEEQDRLREMEDWIIKNEGTWVLAEGFINFIAKVLTDKSMPSEGRIALLKLLAYGTGMDDCVLILHMDRKDHVLMNYAQQIDRLPILEQEAVALFVSLVLQFMYFSHTQKQLLSTFWKKKTLHFSNHLPL